MGTKIDGIPFHGSLPNQKHYIGPNRSQRMFQKAEQVAEYAGMGYGVARGLQAGRGQVAPVLRGARGVLDQIYEDWYQTPFPEAAQAAFRMGIPI